MTVTRSSIWKNNFTLFQSGIATSPNSIRTHGAWATEQRLLGEKEMDEVKRKQYFAVATEEFKRVLTIYSKDIEGLYNLAVTFYEAGKPDSALIAYNQLLKIYPKHYNAIKNSAILYFENKNYAESINLNLKLLKSNPDDEFLKRDVAVSYIKWGIDFFNRRDYLKAKANFESALKFDPYSHFAFTNLGACYQAFGEFDEAIKNYQKSIAIDPRIRQLDNLVKLQNEQQNFMNKPQKK